MLYCCHFQSCMPRPQWIQYLPHHPRTGWKRSVLRGNCGTREAARLKRTTHKWKELEEIIPASTVSGGKEKQIIHWEIKREQLPQLLRPFCVPLKLFLKRRQAFRQMHSFTWLGISKFWPWTETHCNTEHQETVEENREMTAAQFCSKIPANTGNTGWVIKLGRFTCELKLLQVHLFGKGVFECQLESAGGTDLILNHYYWQETPGFHIHLRLSTSSLQST